MFDSPLSNTPDDLLSPLQQLIEMGGPVMLVLLVLAAAGLVTFFYLMLSGALFAPRLTPPLRNALDNWQQQPSHQHSELADSPAGCLARVNPMRQLITFAMTARLERHDPANLREELARRAQKALQPFEAPLKIIEVIAALAPLLGLLGTVMGMMAAFSAMSASAGQAGASELSGGIYEALTTTAAGLVVAIPFAALAAWIEFRLRRLNTTINDVLVRVITTRLPSPELATQQPSGHGASDITTSTPRVAHVTG